MVSVLSDRKHVSIAVSDTGIGIAKDDLSRIFGRFWRADASRAREAGGLGVGLAVTKQIVERHHGYISVESELGKGYDFYDSSASRAHGGRGIYYNGALAFRYSVKEGPRSCRSEFAKTCGGRTRISVVFR